MIEVSKEEVLDIVLRFFYRSEDKLPNKDSIEQITNELLKVYSKNIQYKEWIIAQALSILVTDIGEAKELVNPNDYVEWLDKHDKSVWRSWPCLKEYLKEVCRRPALVLNELDRSSDRVLELLGDPNRQGLWDRRGMVVGHVQSGKTQHYIAVAAKAIDAGYKLVIILSGIHENLRQQTQERIEELITGKNSRDHFQPFGVRRFASKLNINSRRDIKFPDISSLTSVESDYGASINRTIDIPFGTVPVILVIKKNVSILRNLLKRIRGAKEPYTINSCPTLIIDDEADHSSVNTAKIDEDTDPTKTNGLIRKILWACDKVAFVGYTATPYANIFMEDQWIDKKESRNIDEPGSDLFPRAFIIGLDAPTDYIGPDVVFGHDGDEIIGIPERKALPMHETVSDTSEWLPSSHKRGFEIKKDLPDSLKEAIQAFILAIAARDCLDQKNAHCSMLVHVTRFNETQAQVAAQIKTFLECLTSSLEHSNKRDLNFENLKKIWQKVFEQKFDEFLVHPSQALLPPKKIDWIDVKEQLLNALHKVKVVIVNSRSKEGLDFSGNSKKGLFVIAIGGDRLSRGLTLEGLCISYFLRGAKAYDTLMQMGRWFGYRPGFTHFCRVYAEQSIVNNFRLITVATEELRQEFSRMSFLKRTPSDYGLSVREPRADLIVTALAKMRRGQTVKIHFAQSLISSLDISMKDLADNYKEFIELIVALEKQYGPALKDNRFNHLWKNIKWESLVQFMTNYKANSHVCLSSDNGRSLLLNYIESVQQKGDLSSWTVAVIGKETGNKYDERFNFKTIKRNRLYLPQDQNFLLFRDRVVFKGVATGPDEALDLSENQKNEAIKLKDNFRSLASSYRAQRPSTSGLLCLYPIDSSNLSLETKDPVIGVAVSLPSSKYDKGFDYVCTPQKMREIFGELADDLERDSSEENEQ
jgi:hypothetical protein